MSDAAVPLRSVPIHRGVWLNGAVYMVGYHREGIVYGFSGQLTFETELWRGDEGDGQAPWPKVVNSATPVVPVREAGLDAAEVHP